MKLLESFGNRSSSTSYHSRGMLETPPSLQLGMAVTMNCMMGRDSFINLSSSYLCGGVTNGIWDK